MSLPFARAITCPIVPDMYDHAQRCAHQSCVAQAMKVSGLACTMVQSVRSLRSCAHALTALLLGALLANHLVASTATAGPYQQCMWHVLLLRSCMHASSNLVALLMRNAACCDYVPAQSMRICKRSVLQH